MSSFAKSEMVIYEYDTDIKQGMPLCVDDNTLAFHIGIRNKTLWWLIKTKNDHYKVFRLPQKHKNGTFKKMRPIQAPTERMKSVHKVLNKMFSAIHLPDNVVAYVPGKCPPQDGAKKHVQPGTRFAVDLTDFFNSTKRSWIRKYFYYEIGYNHVVSSMLADLCTYKNFLPQGSPLSGYLANLVAWSRFGKKVKKYLMEHDPNWRFTIYSDDLTITHEKEFPMEVQQQMYLDIVSMITDAGYKINAKKSKIVPKRARHIVLGCTVNEKLNIPRNKYNKIRCLIHNCFHNGFESQAKRCGKNNGAAVVAYIRGMLQYFKQIRLDRYEQLDRKFQEAQLLHSGDPDVCENLY
jgi:hypothetical protein